MRRISITILSLINAAMIFFFIDSLAAVGRYDAGIKSSILHLSYLSIILSIAVLFLLRRPKWAMTIEILALIFFLPLFVHECFPGLIGLFDPNYRSSIDGVTIAPFMRIELIACAIIAIFAVEISVLSLKHPISDRGRVRG